MPRLTASQFMRALPEAVRPQLPEDLRGFKSRARGWLCQLYYRDPNVHYEVWNLGQRRGLFEIGLHFESRNRDVNAALLAGFSRRMPEIKAALGSQWEAEMWDRGWAKVYETVPFEPFSGEALEVIAARLARAMTILQAISIDMD